MSKLILLVGLPASGKTTYAEKLKNENTIVLSSDAIRKELFCDEQNQSNNALVFDTLYKRAREFLANGKNVVIDSTNINRFERRRVLDNFEDFSVEKIAIEIVAKKSLCVERDLKRNRTVGEDIIESFYLTYEKPTLSEGFDKIEIINNN